MVLNKLKSDINEPKKKNRFLIKEIIEQADIVKKKKGREMR